MCHAIDVLLVRSDESKRLRLLVMNAAKRFFPVAGGAHTRPICEHKLKFEITRIGTENCSIVITITIDSIHERTHCVLIIDG